ncbi:MAG: hypothetical protein E7369_02755 [Clostridiales bacterium]|nr:hypothetical protein [Clostridiales bacterium]
MTKSNNKILIWISTILALLLMVVTFGAISPTTKASADSEDFPNTQNWAMTEVEAGSGYSVGYYRVSYEALEGDYLFMGIPKSMNNRPATLTNFTFSEYINSGTETFIRINISTEWHFIKLPCKIVELDGLTYYDFNVATGIEYFYDSWGNKLGDCMLNGERLFTEDKVPYLWKLTDTSTDTDFEPLPYPDTNTGDTPATDDKQDIGDTISQWLEDNTGIAISSTVILLVIGGVIVYVLFPRRKKRK